MEKSLEASKALKEALTEYTDSMVNDDLSEEQLSFIAQLQKQVDVESEYDDMEIDETYTENTRVRDASESININGRVINPIVRYEATINDIKHVFSRDDMSKIYRLYSSEGLNRTQKQLCREFLSYNKKEMASVLRAFEITKASPPFAPHDLEEMSNSELIEKTHKIKESSYFVNAEFERIKYLEKKNSDLYNENKRLKEVHELAKGFDFSNIKEHNPHLVVLP